MTGDHHFNPNVSEVDPKEDISPNFEMIIWDIQLGILLPWGSVDGGAALLQVLWNKSVRVMEILWELILRDDLLPESGRSKHLLWVLYFLKVYPKQSRGCLVVGASAGAVNQKTHRK